MKIVLVGYQNCSAWGLTGVLEILQISDRINQTIGDKTISLKCEIVGERKGDIITASGLKINIEKTFREISNPDLVVIPGSDINMHETLTNNEKVIDYITDMYNNGAQIASFCTGVFLVAASGILDNKCASTHWFRSNQFKKMFPQITLKDERIIIDEGNIFLGGGATSYQTLIIYLIEKYLGKRVALATAKMLLIDINKDLQSSYAIFSLQKNHSDTGIYRLQQHIEENYANRFSIEYLADFVAISQRTFMRRFKKATGDTPLFYIQRVKVEAAKKLLESTNLTFEEIARNVGYGDISSFRQLFKKIAGLAPTDYRKKYTFDFVK